MFTLSRSLLTLTALCSVLAVSANAASPPHGRGALAAHMPRLAEFIRERAADVDTNNDGKISQEEFLAPRLARVDKMIARLDANGDGLISQEEMRPPALPERPARRKRLSRVARPHVDRAEVLACIQSSIPDFDPPTAADHGTIESRFSEADTNGDGKLTLAELSAQATARAQAQFTRLDKDADGYLTAADRKAAQAERAALATAMQSCLKAGK